MKRPADPRHRRGLEGEHLAAAWLSARGFTIVARRFRRRIGELDLVALDGSVVVFVEVRSRSATSHGRPAETIRPAKRRRLARTALLFLHSRGWLERPARFDVVEVVGNGPERRVLAHHRDAFRPDLPVF